jgi:hypothetical protein
MTTYEILIAYKEGVLAYRDNVCCSDNPYNGVSETLELAWEDGWWTDFYEGVE